jgi:hypothetical protein
MVVLVDAGMQRIPNLHIAYYNTALYGQLLLMTARTSHNSFGGCTTIG